MLSSIGSLFKRSCTVGMLFTRDFSTKLFIAGLSYDTNETVLRDAFGQHGEIIEAKVICDHKSGKSKGYGFVRFTSEAEASMARKEMNGKLVDGRSIRVSYAHKDQKKGGPVHGGSYKVGTGEGQDIRR